jgi:hypothetical protein
VNEQRLRDLDRAAQDLVDLPDLASLERRGRALRFRRQAGGVAAAVVLATTAVFLFQDRTAEPQPAPPEQPEQFSAYPGPLMTTLEAGTYVLTPSFDADDPTATVTVPEGWNAWAGPNRFNGHRAGDSDNSEALKRSTWGVGVLVIKVDAVATEPCQSVLPDPGTALDYQQTVTAVSQLPGYQVSGLEETLFDGLPATRLHLEPTAAQQACDRRARVFGTEANGALGVRGGLDVWVVDVRGSTLTVVAYSRGDVPERYQDELAQVTDSITVVLPD